MKTSIRYLSIGIVSMLMIGMLLIACERKLHQPTAPGNSSQPLTLKLIGGFEDAQAKTTGGTIRILQLDGVASETEVYRASFAIANNLRTPVTLDPPPSVKVLAPDLCRYRIEVRLRLSRGTEIAPPTDPVIDACDATQRALTLRFDPYEDFRIANPIRIEKNGVVVTAAKAVEPLRVSCGNVAGVGEFDAPEIADQPLTITLREERAGGKPFERGRIASIADAVVSGDFPDPYVNDLLRQTSRTFACRISDGVTARQFSASVTRILPEPIKVSIQCDTVTVTINREHAYPEGVSVKVRQSGMTTEFRYAIESNVSSATFPGFAGATYTLLDYFNPPVENSTVRPYQAHSTQNTTTCPTPTPVPTAIPPTPTPTPTPVPTAIPPTPTPANITISPVCLGGSLFEVQSSQAVAQDTVVTHNQMSGSLTIPAGSTLSSVPGGCSIAAPPTTVIVTGVMPTTDGSGKAFVIGAACACQP